MYKCKHCGKEFDKAYQVAAHTTMCRENPNSRPNKHERKYVTVTKTCPKCGKEFSFEVLEISYLRGHYYDRTYCSDSCSHSHVHSEETKKNIGLGVQNFYKEISSNKNYVPTKNTNKKRKIKHIEHICKCCGNKYFGPKPMVFCSSECYDKGMKLTCQHCQNTFYSQKFRKYCSEECKRIFTHNKFSEGGRKGIASQMSIRRSKAETLFCELCEGYFNKVTHNDPIFNGWDADVLIWDYKIAVLWNGKWHYEQITKKHSVKQVQNRDRIKCKEIEDCGWEYYIIKDLNKFNPDFVYNEFEKFKEYISRDRVVA